MEVVPDGELIQQAVQGVLKKGNHLRNQLRIPFKFLAVLKLISQVVAFFFISPVQLADDFE